MQTKIIFSILLTTLIISSCEKDDPLPKVEDPPCQLISETFYNPNASNSQKFNFFYKEDGFIETIERIQVGGNYYINGQGPFFSEPDTTYLVYEFQNGLATRSTIVDGSSKWFHEYEYDGNLLTKSTVLFADSSVQEYNLFFYDEQDRLIEVIDSSTQVNFRYTLQYENDNLVSIEKEILWSSPQQKAKYTFSNFDNQINFSEAIKGLPITFIWFNNLHVYSSSSPNNSQAQNYHVPINIDEDYNNWLNTEYTYEYNEEGFPTFMNYAGWEVTFEYICE